MADSNPSPPMAPAHRLNMNPLLPSAHALRHVLFEKLIPYDEKATMDDPPPDAEAAYVLTPARDAQMQAAIDAAATLAHALVPNLRPRKRRAPSTIKKEDMAALSSEAAQLPPGAREFPARAAGLEGPLPNDTAKQIIEKQRIAIETKKVELTFPADLAGPLIGKGGSNIERIKSMSSCRLMLRGVDGTTDVSKLAPDAPAKVSIIGPNSENVGVAVAQVQQSLVNAPQWQTRVANGTAPGPSGVIVGAVSVPMVKSGGMMGEADPDGGIWVAIPEGRPLAEGGKTLGFEVDPPTYPGRKVRRKAELGLLAPPPEPLPFHKAPAIAGGSSAAPLPGSKEAMEMKKEMREKSEQRRLESGAAAAMEHDEEFPPPPAGGPSDASPSAAAGDGQKSSYLDRFKAQASTKQDAGGGGGGGGGGGTNYPPPPPIPEQGAAAAGGGGGGGPGGGARPRPGLGARRDNEAEDKIDIPSTLVSIIIGKQGMTIRGIQERSGGKVDIYNHDPSRADARQLQRAMDAGVPPGQAAVMLRGSADSVAKARAEVENVIQQHQNRQAQNQWGRGGYVPQNAMHSSQRGGGYVPTAQQPPPPPMPPPPVQSEWTAYSDEQGRTFYYNTRTGESSWTVPEGYVTN